MNFSIHLFNPIEEFTGLISSTFIASASLGPDVKTQVCVKYDGSRV